MRKVARLLTAGSALIALSGPSVAWGSTHHAKAVRLHVVHKAIPWAGQRIAVHAHLTKTSGRCTWSVRPRVKGFGKTVKCHTNMARRIKLPANLGTTAKKYAVHVHRRTMPKTTATVVLTVASKSKGLLAITAPAATPSTTPVNKPSTTSATSTGSVRANIDPTYTQDSTNPLKVTFAYSASDSDDTLPDGTLTLGIFVHGQTSSAYSCTANVGGSATGSTCTVTLSQYGKWDLVTTYSGGTGVSATSATETVDIENPTPATTTTTTTATTTTTTPPWTKTATLTMENTWDDGTVHVPSSYYAGLVNGSKWEVVISIHMTGANHVDDVLPNNSLPGSFSFGGTGASNRCAGTISQAIISSTSGIAEVAVSCPASTDRTNSFSFLYEGGKYIDNDGNTIVYPSVDGDGYWVAAVND